MITNLNLGCGTTSLPGFINVDSRKGANVVYVCDFLQLPFDNSSVNTIYMCHSLEHIHLHLDLPFLGLCRRVLIDGVSLYISVLVFSVLASLYLSGRVPLSTIVRAINRGQEYEGKHHCVSFDLSFLSDLLVQAGFSQISHYQPSRFLPVGFEDTSTYKIEGKSIGLNLCATT